MIMDLRKCRGKGVFSTRKVYIKGLLRNMSNIVVLGKI